MSGRSWLCAFVFLLPSLAAQNVVSLALPDPLDSRPTTARLTARLGELTAEANYQIGLGNLAAASNITNVVTSLQAYQAGMVVIPNAGPDVLAVSFYEGQPNPNPVGMPTATLNITRVGGPITLFLNAYDPIEWTIQPLPPGTSIAQIVVVSYEPQVLIGVPSGVPVTQIDQFSNGTYYGLPYELEGRVDIAAQCLTRFGQLPNTFTGDYTAPATPFEVGPGDQEWLDQWVLFQAVSLGQALNTGTFGNLLSTFLPQVYYPILVPPAFAPGASSLVAANPLGAITPPLVNLGGITNYCFDAAPNVYVLDNRVPSLLNLSTFTASPLPPLPPGLPPFSFVNTIAFDLFRNRLLVGSFGGAGELYTYDPATSNWAVLTSLFNNEPAAMVYDPIADALWCIDQNFGSGSLDFIRRDPGTGAVLTTTTLALSTWGFILDTFQLSMLGSNVIMIGPTKDVLGVGVRHTFVIDPNTADIVFAGFLAG